MKKFIFFFLLLSVFISNNLSANKNLKGDKSTSGCTFEIGKNYFINYDKIKISKIEIDTANYRNWTVNSIKIITSNTRYIDDIYKKRFKSKITVTFEDNVKCIYQGRIRHSGDQKDHISLHENHILQSVDVHLDEGNIRGITKFKLLRPNTRGVLEDVIIQNQILQQLGYLAPRSIKVDARINKAKSIMLFQEKASKELLEYNLRREGPILEANEKYFWNVLKDLPDNQLSNWSAGVVPLMNKSAKYMLAKLTNANLVIKNENFKNISYEALSKLNYIYLYYANRFQDEKNNFNHWEYDLDNNLLGLNSNENIDKLNLYNLILQSTNSYHGLGSNNRKFYWNSFDNYFEPINYDANPNIKLNNNLVSYRLPIPNNFFEAFSVLEENLMNINLKDFIENLSYNGIYISEGKLRSKFDTIISNSKFIKKNYEDLVTQDEIEHNKFKNIKNISDIYFENINDVDPNIYIVKNSDDNNSLLRCRSFDKQCEQFQLTDTNISNLLEGDLTIDGITYQYLGKNLQINEIGKLKNYNIKIIDKTNILYEDGIFVSIDKENNIINIDQKKPGARIFIKDGELSNLTVKFNGYNLVESNTVFDLKTFPDNYPINNKTLTGCLTFSNLKVTKVSIFSNHSSCEDAVNFVNVSGNIETISISNSFSDALDIDFSQVKINTININSAVNDCTDFSSGIYYLKELKLSNCGDKALSVGEKSTIKVKKIDISNSNYGIASKDSSIVSVNDANLNNLETCVAAYKKKQEFHGAFIELDNMSCSNFYKKADLDQHSKIIVNKKDLKNKMYGDTYKLSSLKILNSKNNSSKKNFHRDFEALNKDGSANVVIEIPSGTNEKWEVSKTNEGHLKREFYMGKPRNINFKPFPINYGIIPNTVLPLNIGGDGDPLDAIVLGPPIEQGSVVKVKILGVLRMLDYGDNDDKIVTVPINHKFSKFDNLRHFRSENPGVLENVTNWFENYKGKNVVKFNKFDSTSEASKLIKNSRRYYKKSGLKPRG